MCISNLSRNYSTYIFLDYFLGDLIMTVQLAPRPKNEERRIVAVKRTGLIDNNQDENFSIFCDTH